MPPVKLNQAQYTTLNLLAYVLVLKTYSHFYILPKHEVCHLNYDARG
jgi:hypothetical protein